MPKTQKAGTQKADSSKGPTKLVIRGLNQASGTFLASYGTAFWVDQLLGYRLATIPALWVNPAFRHRFCEFIFLDPAFWDFQLSGIAFVESCFGPIFLGNPAFWLHLLISILRSNCCSWWPKQIRNVEITERSQKDAGT